MNTEISKLYKRIEKAQTESDALKIIKAADALEDKFGMSAELQGIRPAVIKRIEALQVERMAYLQAEESKLRKEVKIESSKNRMYR